jgi:hypothetical protein
MDAQSQLSGNCGASEGTELIMVLNAILGNYGSSYRTLACSVHLCVSFVFRHSLLLFPSLCLTTFCVDELK